MTRPIWLEVGNIAPHLGRIEAHHLRVVVRCPCGGEVELHGRSMEAFCPQCERPYRMKVRITTEWRGGSTGRSTSSRQDSAGEEVEHAAG